jgi:hypothetical protein
MGIDERAPSSVPRLREEHLRRSRITAFANLNNKRVAIAPRSGRT